MIKKQKRWIALLVALTFAWLLQVSAMPLAANGASATVAAAGADQEPGFVEAAAPKAAPAKTKSILPLVLIGVGVVAVAAVLVLVVFKTKYDITGTWDFTFITSGYTEYYSLSFRGSKSAGDFSFVAVPIFFGSYAVDGKKVTMTLPSFPLLKFAGEFTGKDSMSGTWVNVSTTTWTAVRAGTAAAAPMLPAGQSKLLPR
jgi:hypothetical protein